jgi:hypothetical protein
VSPPFAHIGGLPVEELVPALAPAAAAMASMAAGFVTWLRRR